MTPTDWTDPAVCERAYRASIFTEPAATELRGAIGEIRRLRARVATLTGKMRDLIAECESVPVDAPNGGAIRVVREEARAALAAADKVPS